MKPSKSQLADMAQLAGGEAENQKQNKMKQTQPHEKVETLHDQIARKREMEAFIRTLREENEKLRSDKVRLQDVIRVKAEKGPSGNSSKTGIRRRSKSRRRKTSPNVPVASSPYHVSPRLLDSPARSPRHVKPIIEGASIAELDSLLQTLGERVANSASLSAALATTSEQADNTTLLNETTETTEAINDLRRQLSESRAKVVQLQHAFDSVEAGLNAAKRVQEAALARADAATRDLREAAEVERSQRERIDELERAQTHMQAQSVVVDDLRSTNTNLQAQVKLLTKSAFTADAAEASRIQEVVENHSKEMAAMRATLQSKDHALDRAEEAASRAAAGEKQAREELAAVKAQKDSVEAEMKLERERMKALDARLGALQGGDDAEMDELDAALAFVRRRRENGDEESGDDASLRAKIEKLEMQNRELVVQLRQKDDMVRVHASLSAEVDAKRARIERAHEALIREHSDLRRAMAMRPRADSVVSELSLLSQMSLPSMSGSSTANVIVLRVVAAEIFAAAASDALSEQQMLSFVGVDFFEFETCYSGVFAGSEPAFALTSQYRVDVDAFLMRYLQERSATIDLFRQQEPSGEVVKLGSARVQLDRLLDVPCKIRRSVDVIPIGGGEPVARVDIVVKMYRPVISAAVSVAGESCEVGTTAIAGNNGVEAYTVRVTLRVKSFSAGTVDLVKAMNVYYDLDAEADRTTVVDASGATDAFVFAFRSAHETLLPHEVVVLEFMHGDQLQGRVRLPLQLLADQASGGLEKKLDVRNHLDKIVGDTELAIEWIMSANDDDEQQ